MNPGLPLSTEALLVFIPLEGHDSIGDYHIFTGYEGTGVCWWCGGELPRRSKRWCRQDRGTDDAHWHQYYRHFAWGYAVNWCFQRYDFHCANCGLAGADRGGDQGLEVHHIVPLEARPRAWSVFNLPWNLILLCHECHMELHRVMREASRPDPFDMALKKGQLVFSTLKEING